MSKASETVRTMTREYQLSVAGDLARTIESELGEAAAAENMVTAAALCGSRSNEGRRLRRLIQRCPIDA